MTPESSSSGEELITKLCSATSSGCWRSRMLEEGKSAIDVAKAFGVDRSTIYRATISRGLPMTDTVENLILDLLEWVGCRERTYRETMDAWRTSCPKLPVWEDASDRGLVETASSDGRSVVRVTPSGLSLLREKRPHSYEEPKRDARERISLGRRADSDLGRVPGIPCHTSFTQHRDGMQISALVPVSVWFQQPRKSPK